MFTAHLTQPGSEDCLQHSGGQTLRGRQSQARHAAATCGLVNFQRRVPASPTPGEKMPDLLWTESRRRNIVVLSIKKQIPTDRVSQVLSRYVYQPGNPPSTASNDSLVNVRQTVRPASASA